MGFGGGKVDGLDVSRGDQEEVTTVADVMAHTALSVADVDALQLVGDETGIAPRLGIAQLIDLCDERLVLRPGGSCELVVVFVDATTGDLQQFVDGEIRELKTVGETRGETRVEFQQTVHLVLVAAEHDGDVALVFVGKDVH